jgi:pimeloyl-ACP methyl ester carboxylesterase
MNPTQPPNVPATDSMVAVPGGEILVRCWPLPSNDTAPILLLHDSLGSVEQWRTFPELLARSTGRSVYAYDRLGFGHSTPRVGRPSDRFVLEEAEEVLPALCAALGIERWVLFGHSIGGGMALTMAARHPRRCEAVIAESAQAFIEERTLEGIRRARVQFADQGVFERLVRWHGERARWVLDAWTEVWSDPRFRDWSLDAVLSRVACPVLALHGTEDEFGSRAFPEHIVRMVGAGAQLALLEGCGHVPHRERVDDVLRLVERFLESRK